MNKWRLVARSVPLGQKWERCLKTLRQRRRHKKYRIRRLELPQKTYFTVQWLADEMQLTLAETIQKVAKAELDKLYDADFKKKQRTIKKATG